MSSILFGKKYLSLNIGSLFFFVYRRDNQETRYFYSNYRRFISSDSMDYLSPTDINGLNLYCYCNNDSVNYHGHGLNLSVVY